MSGTEHRRDAELPNVLRLYEELGVHPEDGVARLTERYRLRLRALHPDLRPEGSGQAAGDLGWLTRSYRDAVAFERRHGRLPGAALPGSDTAAPAATGSMQWQPPVRGARRSTRVRGTGRWRWLLAGAAMATLLLMAASEIRQRFDLASRAMEPLATIRVGSTMNEVLRIEGPPLERRGARWHYGASWIAFRDGRVADWHSAKERPLQVDQVDAPDL